MILVAVSVVILLCLAFAGVIYRLALRVDQSGCGPEWLEEFSMERFAPMERLLDPVDIEFVKSQPGYRPSIGDRLIRERKQAFAGYLRLLTEEFNKLMSVGRWMVVHSSEDRTAFAKALRRQHVRFYLAMFAAHCRLALYPMAQSRIDVRGLVNSMAGLHREIQNLALQQSAA